MSTLATSKSPWQEANGKSCRKEYHKDRYWVLFLFDIFINDIIYELQGVCSLLNYADDNTICCSHSDMNILNINLEKSANFSIKMVQNQSYEGKSI